MVVQVLGTGSLMINVNQKMIENLPVHYKNKTEHRETHDE